MIHPETRYTNVGRDRVAYQVVGEGTRDIVYTSGFWNHLDIEWEDPDLARFYRRLASFARLIRFDRRGTGLSDRPTADGRSEVEHWLQDCSAVLDAARSEAPIFFAEGTIDAGPLVLQHVDRHPERCTGLIFYNAGACAMAKPGYAEGLTPEALQQVKERFREAYGTAEFAADVAPNRANDDAFRRWFAKLCRAMASPRAVIENMECWDELDARSVLPRICVPTLVMAGRHVQLNPSDQTRYLAHNIPGARFVELPAAEGILLCWAAPDQVDLVEEFVTGRRPGGDAEHVVATLLFTDIVDSTGRAAQMGNVAWHQLLDRHDQVVRIQVPLFHGRLVDSAGDGTLTTFGSPGHALDCAQALNDALIALGIEIRAGLHTGEVELREDGRIGGIAVHFAARVMAAARVREILVSHTVHGILLGSRYCFEERGVHDLKGVPGRWPLYALAAKTGTDPLANAGAVPLRTAPKGDGQ